MTTVPKRIGLYVVEEQELYRELYPSMFASRPEINLLQVSPCQDIAGLSRHVSIVKPDVLLVSARKMGEGVIAELEATRINHPHVGIAVLLINYDDGTMESLRKLTIMSRSAGMALFLKQSLDLADQLCGIIASVSQGQVILDPLLTASLFAEEPVYPFLKQLTSRETEILDMVSQGYTNAKIAQTLFIDLKTVEHHINSMYGKMKSETDFSQKHPRVSAARLYLQATGALAMSTSR